MKFWHIFTNYIRFIKKQGTTSWLILIYPIILIMLIGIGLNIGAKEKLSVAVYGEDPVLDLIADNPDLHIINTGSEHDLEDLVRSKEAVMGVSIEKNVSRKTIRVYLDPTKQAVVSNLLLMVDKAVNEEKMRSGASLSAIQEKLAPSLVEMKAKKGEISAFSDEIKLIKQNVSAIKSELSGARAKLSDYKTELLQYKTSLNDIDTYQAKLGSYDKNLSQISYDLYYRQNQRDQTSNKISNTIWKINSYITDVDNALYYTSNAKSYYDPTGYSSYYLDQLETELKTLKTDLQTTKSDLQTIQGELNNIDFYSMQNQISIVRSDIKSTNSSLASFKSKALTKINSLISDIDATDAKILSAMNGLDGFSSDLDALDMKVQETRTLMDKMISPLEEFLGKTPEELLPPQIESVSVFEEKKWMDLFFPSIIGIDMILACILLPMIMKVRMRDQGVELRMVRSKAGTLSVITGEMMANYLVSFLQLCLIFLFSIIFFNVQLGNPLGVLFVLITLPVVFTSLGVLLSQMVQRSSTAFLLSLLIGIPLIFISGTIIPLEFLNPFIAFVGRIAPLYMVIDFTEKVLFRDAYIVDVLINYSYLFFFTLGNYVLACLVYFLKR